MGNIYSKSPLNPIKRTTITMLIYSAKGDHQMYINVQCLCSFLKTENWGQFPRPFVPEGTIHIFKFSNWVFLQVSPNSDLMVVVLLHSFPGHQSPVNQFHTWFPSLPLLATTSCFSLDLVLLHSLAQFHLSWVTSKLSQQQSVFLTFKNIS